MQKGLTVLKFLIILGIFVVFIIGGIFLVKKYIFKPQGIRYQVNFSPTPKILLGTPCKKDADCSPEERCDASGSGTISVEGKQVPPIPFCKTK